MERCPPPPHTHITHMRCFVGGMEYLLWLLWVGGVWETGVVTCVISQTSPQRNKDSDTPDGLYFQRLYHPRTVTLCCVSHRCKKQKHNAVKVTPLCFRVRVDCGCVLSLSHYISFSHHSSSGGLPLNTCIINTTGARVLRANETACCVWDHTWDPTLEKPSLASSSPNRPRPNPAQPSPTQPNAT